MTDKELIVAKRVCQYTKAIMPPVKWSSGYTTNPALSAMCSAVRSIIYLRCGVYKSRDARTIPMSVFTQALDEILPDKEVE